MVGKWCSYNAPSSYFSVMRSAREEWHPTPVRALDATSRPFTVSKAFDATGRGIFSAAPPLFPLVEPRNPIQAYSRQPSASATPSHSPPKMVNKISKKLQPPAAPVERRKWCYSIVPRPRPLPIDTTPTIRPRDVTYQNPADRMDPDKPWSFSVNPPAVFSSPRPTTAVIFPPQRPPVPVLSTPRPVTASVSQFVALHVCYNCGTHVVLKNQQKPANV